MHHDEITNKRVRRIARQHNCTVVEVHKALDRHPIEIVRDTFLKRTLALELSRLDELEEAFHEKAMVDRDTAAGALLVKIFERRATLLGLNPVQGHAVQIIQHEPADKPNSTQQILEVINRLRAERPLKRQERDGVVWYTPGTPDDSGKQN